MLVRRSSFAALRAAEAEILLLASITALRQLSCARPAADPGGGGGGGGRDQRQRRLGGPPPAEMVMAPAVAVATPDPVHALLVALSPLAAIRPAAPTPEAVAAAEESLWGAANVGGGGGGAPPVEGAGCAAAVAGGRYTLEALTILAMAARAPGGGVGSAAHLGPCGASRALELRVCGAAGLSSADTGKGNKSDPYVRAVWNGVEVRKREREKERKREREERGLLLVASLAGSLAGSPPPP